MLLLLALAMSACFVDVSPRYPCGACDQACYDGVRICDECREEHCPDMTEEPTDE